jgi:hypothetical protein
MENGEQEDNGTRRKAVHRYKPKRKGTGLKTRHYNENRRGGARKGAIYCAPTNARCHEVEVVLAAPTLKRAGGGRTLFPAKEKRTGLKTRHYIRATISNRRWTGD